MGRRQTRRMVMVRKEDLEAEKERARVARETQMYKRDVRIDDVTRMRSIRSIGGAGAKSSKNSRERWLESEAVNIEVNEKGGSFSDQFFATLQRTIQQKRRNLITLILEIAVPLLFVLGTIILWAAFGDEVVGERSELNYSTPTSSVMRDFYMQILCNNRSMGVIEAIPTCDHVPYEVSCEGDESTLPAKGLCYDAMYRGPTSIVGQFVNAILGNVSALPSMDSIILYQWLSRKSASDSNSAAAMTLAGSGLAENNRMNAIMSSGNLYFAPAAKVPKSLIDYFNQSSALFRFVYGGTFETVEEANTYISSGKALNWALIEIRSLTKEDFDVELHMNASALPPLASVVDITYPGGFQFDHGEMYPVSGFSTLQKMLYDYHLQYNHDYYDLTVLNPFFASFGSGAYRRKVLLETASPLVAFILVLSFLYPTSQLTKQIVLEKELRIREAMLIMGLSNSSLYLSWFVVYALQYMLECILMVVLLKSTYVLSSDPFMLFFLFYIFALSTIPLSGLIASFFSKARIASMLTPLIFFALAVPTFAFTKAKPAVILGVSLLSPTAFAASLTNILTLETSVGFYFSDLHNSELNPQSWILLLLLGVDFFVYYVLMLYFDCVLPKDWGTTKHPLFFIMDPIKALCCSHPTEEDSAGHRTNVDGRAEDGVFEEVNDDEAAVRIVGLRKEYERGGVKFAAVNNFYWAMKSGEISVLLGHNGAGKTTAMNMMTGMVQPDEGDCYINGYSVRTQLSRVRQQIGFCPQHNILWPELTCREHLEYFGKIKGLHGTALEDAVRLMLAEVDLLDKIENPSHALSGGMKRKLSVAIAFVGRSALVFLDEPTAGMDVGARRYTWELLRRMSSSHTILLTTHYMDEADLLGHRIGIMSHGRLQCSGSSMFLKSRLGVGYNMSISVAPEADAEAIDRLVVSLVGSAEASSFNGVEIVYKLPMKDVETFPSLLAGLEQHGEAVGVRGYSLSATTLEEVFLQIALADHKKRDAEGPSETDAATEEAEEKAMWHCEIMTSSRSRLHSQFTAMMEKRLWNALRDRRMQCFQIVCPVVCILLAMLLTLVDFNEGSFTLDMSGYMFGVETEMEVSNCGLLFGPDLNNSVRQNTILYDHNMYNAEDLSLYTIDTANLHTKPRYTSMQCDDIGMRALLPSTDNISILFYNTSAYHASGLVLTQFYNYVLQNVTGNTSQQFRTSTSSMPSTSSDVKTKSGVQVILIGAIVMIPFTFLPSNPVAWIVKERECKARHLQNVTGLNFYVYWLTNFLFDMAAYVVTLFLVMVIFFIFSRQEYVSKEALGPTIIMFLIYGLCSTVAGYCVSFAFNEHSAAQTVTMAGSFVAGFLLVMMVFILSLLDKTKDVSKHLRWPFRIVPSYCVGESIINLAMTYQESSLGRGSSPWSLDVTGWPMIYMAVEFPVFFILALIIDHPARRLWGQEGSYERGGPAEIIDDEDSDVEDERKAVYEAELNNINEDVVRVVDLRKVYDNNKVAIRNLAFSILPDEVFGFLGTNGAGKTTAISILCQEFVPTSGCAYVCGYDVVDQSAEALQCIGYCPQFDATLDLLTVEEHLRLYAGIRGIVEEQRDDVVRGLIRLCGIKEYTKTTAGSLSGGNRRKLSMAMSLIGSPQIVFLDEPSAGMDPVARRGMWTAIQRASQNCSVVLTTHHLEEVEALADTVGIMADGALRCIGDKIHLKSKYGSGFEMSIRIRDGGMRVVVEKFIQSAFPEAVLNEFKSQRFVFALPQDTKLSETFWTLQQNKERLGITDYSVSQTSIEQVFLRISEQQEERTDLGEKRVRFTESHATLHHYRAVAGKGAETSEDSDQEKVARPEAAAVSADTDGSDDAKGVYRPRIPASKPSAKGKSAPAASGGKGGPRNPRPAAPTGSGPSGVQGSQQAPAGPAAVYTGLPPPTGAAAYPAYGYGAEAYAGAVPPPAPAPPVTESYPPPGESPSSLKRKASVRFVEAVQQPKPTPPPQPPQSPQLGQQQQQAWMQPYSSQYNAYYSAPNQSYGMTGAQGYDASFDYYAQTQAQGPVQHNPYVHGGHFLPATSDGDGTQPRLSDHTSSPQRGAPNGYGYR